MGLDVLAVGITVIDLLVRVPEFPRIDGRTHMSDFAQAIGGNATIAAVALARLGARAGFAGAVGDDFYGQQVRDGLAEDGLDISLLDAVHGGRTPTTVIISDAATQTRSIINDPLTAHAVVTPTEAMMRAALTPTYLHLDYAALAALAPEILPRCRAAGVIVSYDAGVMLPDMAAYLPLIDVYMTTREQLADLTGTADLERGLAWIRAAGPRVAGTTLGRDGSAGLSDDGTLVHAPAFAVDVVDTTGAGDVFHGGFLFALLRGAPMREALAFANATAALSCRALGGRPGCPTLGEVERLLARGKVHATSIYRKDNS